jgi:hypothetical protein
MAYSTGYVYLLHVPTIETQTQKMKFPPVSCAFNFYLLNCKAKQIYIDTHILMAQDPSY